MEYETKAKVGSYYKNGRGELRKIIKTNYGEIYPIVDNDFNSYTLDGGFLSDKPSKNDLDLSKEYDEGGNMLCDHSIDISKIPTVDDQKKFTEELNDKLKNPYLRQEGGSHYKDMVIQPIDYILKNNIGFAEGNVIKYVSRWKNKNGVMDLKKALHILQILVYEEENKWVYLKH